MLHDDDLPPRRAINLQPQQPLAVGGDDVLRLS
jgi:hypothetical protein